jgi:tetratricopeptide (TPR) repeat protein
VRAGSDPARAADYAVRAGERAVAQLADDEAVTYFRQAHDLLTPDDEPRRVELLIALGGAQRRAGHAAHRQTLLAAAGLARARGDVDGLARAAIANSPGSKPSTFGLTDHERVATLEAALAAVGPGDDPRRARLLAVLALELFHTPDRRRRLAASDEALAIARRLDQPEVLSDVLVARPFAIGGPETLAERLADTAELLQVARRLADPVIEHRAWWSRFRVAVEVGDTAEADRCLAAEQALMGDVGQPTPRWMTGLQEVATALRQGRFADAAALTEAVYEQGRLTGQPDARLYYAIQLFQRCYEQGRLTDAEGVVAEVVAASPELPAIRAALALLYAETGRTDEARALFAAIAGDDLAALPVEASTMVAFGFCAELCFLLGDTRRAGQLHALLAPYADQITVWAVGLGTGSVAHRLGRLAHVLGDLDEADARFTAAAAIERRAGAPPWLARTRRAHDAVTRR